MRVLAVVALLGLLAVASADCSGGAEPPTTAYQDDKVKTPTDVDALLDSVECWVGKTKGECAAAETKLKTDTKTNKEWDSVDESKIEFDWADTCTVLDAAITAGRANPTKKSEAETEIAKYGGCDYKKHDKKAEFQSALAKFLTEAVITKLAASKLAEDYKHVQGSKCTAPTCTVEALQGMKRNPWGPNHGFWDFDEDFEHLAGSALTAFMETGATTRLSRRISRATQQHTLDAQTQVAARPANPGHGFANWSAFFKQAYYMGRLASSAYQISLAGMSAAQGRRAWRRRVYRVLKVQNWKIVTVGVRNTNQGSWRSSETLPWGLLRKGTSTACLLTIRGSVSVDDWLTDFTAYHTNGVHAGFASAFDDMWPGIKAGIDRVGCTSMICVGHSLGAAMADLFCTHIGPYLGVTPTVWTIGEPRPATDAYWTRMHGLGNFRKHYRVVNNRDPVPGVPPAVWPFSYRHKAEISYWMAPGGAGGVPNDVTGFDGTAVYFATNPLDHMGGNYLPAMAARR